MASKGSASDGGGGESGGDNGKEERERGWANQLMANIVRKRYAAGGGVGGVGGSRGVANEGDGDDDDPSFRRDKRSLARGRDVPRARGR